MNSNKNIEQEILIAEDSHTQAQMLKNLLERHDFRVSVANNGKEALEMIKVRKPAVIISDIVMPEMDGYEFCGHIKEAENLRDIPVILLTALSDPKDVLKGLECGANSFITKPYNEKNIVSKVRSMIENRQLDESKKIQSGIKVLFGSQEYYIKAQPQHILNLLLSTYETAVQTNLELQKVQDELRALTLDLEKKVEERTIELNSVNERYRTMVELSNDAIYILDTRGNFVFANKRAAEMTGYIISEWIGKNFATLVPPSDLPMIKEMFLVTLTGKSTQLEINVIKKDGTILILEVNTTSILEDGNVVGIIGFGRDITARRQAEEALRVSEAKNRRIVDTANEGIWMLSEDLMTTFVNARMAEMIGYRTEDMINRPLTDFMFNEDYPDHHKRMENRRLGLSEHYERKYRHKNGQTVWTMASAVPILDAGQNFKGSFAMFTDISQRKLVEEELQRHREHLEEMVKERTLQLNQKNEELERFNKLFVGRELKMIELKKRIAELEKKS